jgi:carboxymethylenebutenolidase
LTLGRSGSDIEFSCGAGSAAAYRSIPPGGRGRGVLVVVDAPAPAGFARDACDRLARAGWVALAPELPDLDSAGFDVERVAPILDGAIGELLNCDATEGARVGALGFGAAGALAVLVAAKNPRVGAVIDFYGAPEDDALADLDLTSVAAPVLCIFGEADSSVADGAARVIEARLTEAGARVRLLVLSGAGHGFMNEAAADQFDAVAAAAGWDAAQAFLGAEL